MKRWSASRLAVAVGALVAFNGCATTRVASPDHLRRDVGAAESAYHNLAPDGTRTYNAALGSIVRDVDSASPTLLRSELSESGLKIDEPAVQLPLVRYHAVRTSAQPNDSPAIGAPVLLEYDTSRASIYPRDGLFLSATAIYRRVDDQPRLSFITAENRIALGPSIYPLAMDNAAATAMLAQGRRRVAQSGLTNFLHPDVRAKAEIVHTTGTRSRFCWCTVCNRRHSRF